MKYTIVGSGASPYVRRLRLYLQGHDVTFEVINLFDEHGDKRITQLNPLKRIPVLIAGDQVLWESRVIYNFLQRALSRPVLAVHEENAVSAIDALQDSWIQTYLLKRFKHPVERDNPYYQRATEREALILDYLNTAVYQGDFHRWDYPAMSLYCLLDWGRFRGMLDPATLGSALVEFHQRHTKMPQVGVQTTDPRLV